MKFEFSFACIDSIMPFSSSSSDCSSNPNAAILRFFLSCENLKKDVFVDSSIALLAVSSPIELELGP
jgi:hypothetical protein